MRLLLPGESAEELEAYRIDLIEHFVPEGPLEAELTERVATLFWRLKRVPAFEAALYEWVEHHEYAQEVRAFKPDHLNPRSLSTLRVSKARELDENETTEGNIMVRKPEIGRALEGMFTLGLFDKIIRYGRALQRQLKDTIDWLLELQRERSESTKEKETKIK